MQLFLGFLGQLGGKKNLLVYLVHFALLYGISKVLPNFALFPMLFLCFKHLDPWKKQNGGHLVCDVNGKLTSLSSLFSCFSWSCGIDWLWRFGGEQSLNYKE